MATPSHNPEAERVRKRPWNTTHLLLATLKASHDPLVVQALLAYFQISCTRLGFFFYLFRFVFCFRFFFSFLFVALADSVICCSLAHFGFWIRLFWCTACRVCSSLGLFVPWTWNVRGTALYLTKAPRKILMHFTSLWDITILSFWKYRLYYSNYWWSYVKCLEKV